MRGQGYEAEQRVSVGPFTTAQRQRLEALTAARALKPGADVSDLLRLADWIYGNGS
jgi:hypothetical protein